MANPEIPADPAKRENLQRLAIFTGGLFFSKLLIGCALGAERPTEPGWMRFRSVNFLYEIDYPSEWEARSFTTPRHEIDVFEGETINGRRTLLQILINPTISTASLRNYADQIEEKEVNKLILERKKSGGADARRSRIKVGSVEGWLIEGEIPTDQIAPELKPAFDITIAIFPAREQVWRASLSNHPSVSKQERARFNRMLTTFKLITPSKK